MGSCCISDDALPLVQACKVKRMEAALYVPHDGGFHQHFVCSTSTAPSYHLVPSNSHVLTKQDTFSCCLWSHFLSAAPRLSRPPPLFSSPHELGTRRLLAVFGSSKGAMMKRRRPRVRRLTEKIRSPVAPGGPLLATPAYSVHVVPRSPLIHTSSRYT